MEPLVHGAGIADYSRCRKINEVACKECKDAAAAYERNRRKSNPEHYKNLEKAWRDRNKEKARQTERNYRKKYPEKQRMKERRRRALINSAESSSYSVKDVLDLWGTDCHICSSSIDMRVTRRCGEPGWEEGLHLDHVIPLSKGGTDLISNVKPSHAKCNIVKSTKTATA